MKPLFATLAFAILFIPAFSQYTITTDSIIQLSTCTGGNVIVNYSTTGSFPFVTTFTAELSDQMGNWTNPIPMGSTFFNSGIIFATIPQGTSFGWFYRIRVKTDNPACIGSDSPNTLIVTSAGQFFQVNAMPPTDTICPGETVTLSANAFGDFMWSTGDTTPAITVTQPGIYSVTVTDFLGCENVAADTLFACIPASVFISPLRNDSVLIYPNPSLRGYGFFLQFPAQPVAARFRLTDLWGREVKFSTSSINSTTWHFDLPSASPGFYLLQVTEADKIRTLRLEIN